MVSKDLIRRYDLTDEELDRQLSEALGTVEPSAISEMIGDKVGDVERDQIVTATVLSVEEDHGVVRVDIGGKAEAPLLFAEFDGELPGIGETLEVFYRGDDRYTNVPVVSKRDADRERAWTKIVGVYSPGDVIDGDVQKLIKGGLIVSIDGVEVFMPSSQIDIRRVSDPSEFVGTVIQAKVVKIDEERRNIVISRRQLLEEERIEKRAELLQDIKEGQTRIGEVKNIADFGAFVDLGGMDGLIHVSELSWKHVDHPSSVVQVGDEVDVQVLEVDLDRERISLSLKATQQDPWQQFAGAHKVGELVYGRVTKLVPFGSFVQVGDSIEGLVHISEMSAHHVDLPEQVVSPGEELWVKIIDLDLQRRRISLSIKQAAEGGVVAAEYQEHFGEHAYDDEGNYIGEAEVEEGEPAVVEPLSADIAADIEAAYAQVDGMETTELAPAPEAPSPPPGA